MHLVCSYKNINFGFRVEARTEEGVIHMFEEKSRQERD